MSITYDSIKQVGDYDWEYRWSGTSPFLMYQDGDVVTGLQTTLTDYIFQGDSTAEPPAIEIVESTATDEPEQLTYPPYAAMQWRRVPNAFYYLIEQNVDSTWTERESIFDDGTDRGYFGYSSTALSDVTEHNFRVSAVDSEGTTGYPLAFTFTMVRNPPPPSIDISYSSSVTSINVIAG